MIINEQLWQNMIKAVAFYLPQFHVIPENDIYGKNFTEWCNVRRAVPLYDGHAQPHIPHGILGYYDLIDEKILTKQHHIAWDNNVTAFCYYYYNMAGRTLLDAPLHIINKSRLIRNEFCLCWAHECWYDNTQPQRIKPFIAQEYSPENARKIIRDLAQYFDNPRHIRIDGKPLLLVFAPERNPLMSVYSQIWREEAWAMGHTELCLAGVECHVGQHPANLGFDVMVEFAPNLNPMNMLSIEGEEPRRFDYVATVQDMLLKETPDYTRLRCAFPGWDNTPRRGRHGLSFERTSVDVFSAALRAMAQHTRAHLPENLQYVFINAWNEWGEGCYLEPDQKDGFAYLHAVRNVMNEFNT